MNERWVDRGGNKADLVMCDWVGALMRKPPINPMRNQQTNRATNGPTQWCTRLRREINQERVRQKESDRKRKTERVRMKEMEGQGVDVIK